MQKQASRDLMRGAWILSLSALIAKILSALYRVPFQNIVGDTGFYAYQQIYPIYGLGMTFALSGFPVYISKLVASASNVDAQLEIAHQSRVILTWFSGAVFVLLEVFSGTIAGWMADPDLQPLIQMVAFMFLTMPILATGRGYFQGTFDMQKTAISQVLEQIVRVLVILLAAIWFKQYHWTVYQMAAIAMTGGFFGGVAAILSIWRPYRRVFGRRRFQFAGWRPYLQLTRAFLLEGGAVTLFSALLILLQLIDSFTVTKGLTASGTAAYAAKALKGIYDRGQPFVQLGLVVATALSTSILPGLTQARAASQPRKLIRVSREMIHLNYALAVAATAGMIVLMPAIDLLLFGDTAGTVPLQVYALCIVLVAMINAYNAILQSLDHFGRVIIALVIGLVIKSLTNLGLVRLYGTLGASAATVLALGIILAVIYWQVPGAIKVATGLSQFTVKTGIATGLMMLVVHFVFRQTILSSRSVAALVVLGGVTLGVLVFVATAAAIKLFNVREVLALPGGRWFLKHWPGLRKEK